MSDSPCTRCGACCSSFRVSFYCAKATALGLAEALYEPVTPTLACMAGTHSKAPRCKALEGQVGSAVRCSVYAQRSTTCRNVQPGDEQCRKARDKHGLSRL